VADFENNVYYNSLLSRNYSLSLHYKCNVKMCIPPEVMHRYVQKNEQRATCILIVNTKILVLTIRIHVARRWFFLYITMHYFWKNTAF
jgi:hypothetical protein